MLHTFEETARKFFNKSPQTIRKHKSQLPGAVIVGKRVMYRDEEILAFIRNGGFRAKAVDVPTPSVRVGARSLAGN